MLSAVVAGHTDHRTVPMALDAMLQVKGLGAHEQSALVANNLGVWLKKTVSTIDRCLQKIENRLAICSTICARAELVTALPDRGRICLNNIWALTSSLNGMLSELVRTWNGIAGV